MKNILYFVGVLAFIACAPTKKPPLQIEASEKMIISSSAKNVEVDSEDDINTFIELLHKPSAASVSKMSINKEVDGITYKDMDISFKGEAIIFNGKDISNGELAYFINYMFESYEDSRKFFRKNTILFDSFLLSKDGSDYWFLNGDDVAVLKGMVNNINVNKLSYYKRLSTRAEKYIIDLMLGGEVVATVSFTNNDFPLKIYTDNVFSKSSSELELIHFFETLDLNKGKGIKDMVDYYRNKPVK